MSQTIPRCTTNSVWSLYTLFYNASTVQPLDVNLLKSPFQPGKTAKNYYTINYWSTGIRICDWVRKMKT